MPDDDDRGPMVVVYVLSAALVGLSVMLLWWLG